MLVISSVSPTGKGELAFLCGMAPTPPLGVRANSREPSVLGKPGKPGAHVFLNDSPEGVFAWVLFRLNADGMVEFFEQRSDGAYVRPEIFIDPNLSYTHTAFGLWRSGQDAQRVHAVSQAVHSVPPLCAHDSTLGSEPTPSPFCRPLADPDPASDYRIQRPSFGPGICWSGAGAMHEDAASKAERYRKEANKYGELAKKAEPGYLADVYRKVAVQYAFMAEDVLRETERGRRAGSDWAG
jgi:hypothetical protein